MSSDTTFMTNPSRLSFKEERPFIVFESSVPAVAFTGALLQAYERKGIPSRSVAIEFPFPEFLKSLLTDLNGIPQNADCIVVGSRDFRQSVTDTYSTHSWIEFSPSSGEEILRELEQLSSTDLQTVLPQELANSIASAVDRANSEDGVDPLSSLIELGFMFGGIDIALKGFSEGFDERYNIKAKEFNEKVLSDEISFHEVSKEPIPNFALQDTPMGMRAACYCFETFVRVDDPVVALDFTLPKFIPGVFFQMKEQEPFRLIGVIKEEALESINGLTPVTLHTTTTRNWYIVDPSKQLSVGDLTQKVSEYLSASR